MFCIYHIYYIEKKTASHINKAGTLSGCSAAAFPFSVSDSTDRIFDIKIDLPVCVRRVMNSVGRTESLLL